MTGIEKMPELKAYENPLVGDAVVSVAGRDKGRVLAVVKVIDAKYVLLADGKHRHASDAKLKKTLHLRKIGELKKFGTDDELTKSLAEFDFDFSVMRARHYKPKG